MEYLVLVVGFFVEIWSLFQRKFLEVFILIELKSNFKTKVFKVTIFFLSAVN